MTPEYNRAPDFWKNTQFLKYISFCINNSKQTTKH